MPIEYHILEDKKLVLAKGSGVVTGDDVIKHLDALAADERYVAPMKKLVDYRTIESIRSTTDEQRFIAEKKKRLRARFAEEKCAFVSPADLTYGTSRMHQALVEHTDLHTAVFRTMEEALAWLDVDYDEPDG